MATTDAQTVARDDAGWIPAPRPSGEHQVTPVIRTPDYRLRVFISSTMGELAAERRVVRESVRRLRLAPVLFEAGARAHPPRALYRSYLEQSHVFLGIYWQRYGWVAPGESVSGLEDEYLLSGSMPKLIYVKHPAPEREGRLSELLDRIRSDDQVSYQRFGDLDELAELVENDLAVLLTEHFEAVGEAAPPPAVVDEQESDTAHPAADTIPVPPTPLVGREQEVAGVLELLQRPDARLVTLTGTGGIGKTRVAIDVATRWRSASGRPVHWVNLSSLTEPAAVAPTIGRALCLPVRQGVGAAEVLADALTDGQHLLVLDGFERLLEAGDLLSQLIERCPDLRLLVTSRAVLGLRAELDWPVPPLTLPEEDQGVPEDSEAVRLFLTSAEAAGAHGLTSPEDLAAIAEICRRLDGLPLAVELAAARARMLSPRALLDRLGSRLPLLGPGPADMPERQQTLRATMVWDYDTLDSDERAMFRRVAVAAGGCTLELAERLVTAAGGLGVDVLDGLDQLIRKSLLRRADVPDGGLRLSMLDTLREFGVEQLEAAGETRAARTAHAAAMLELAEAAAFEGPDSMTWLATCDREHANLRYALDWLAETGDAAGEVRLAAALSQFWEMHGHIVEGSRRLEHALAASRDLAIPARIKALGGASHLARARGDFAAATRLGREALELACTLDDRRGEARSRVDVAAAALEVSDLDTAEEEIRLAHEAWLAIGDQMRIGGMRNNLGVIAETKGDLAAARRYYGEALAIYLEHDDETRIARTMMNLGRLLVLEQEDGAGLQLLSRSLALWNHLNSTWDLADCLEYYASALGRHSLAEAGVRALAVAEALRERIGAPRPPYMADSYREGLVELRAALPKEEFAQAWRQARQQHYRDGIAEALAVAPEPQLLDVADRTVDRRLLEPFVTTAVAP